MQVFERYAELFQMLTGKEFQPVVEKNLNEKLIKIFKDAQS